jgi:hypothetical protein
MAKPFAMGKGADTIGNMKNYKASQASGFFDVELRGQ